MDEPGFDIGTQGPTQIRAQPIAGTALAIAVVAGIIAALELVRPIHGIDASARAAVETATAVAAVIASRLLIEIFDRTRQLRELLLVLGVLALSFADFVYWAGPVVAGVRDPASGGVVRLVWELIGAVALAAAALVPPTAIVEPVRVRAKAAALLGLGVIATATVLAAAIAAHPATGAAMATIPSARAAAHPVTIGVQAVSAAILALAGLAFVGRFWCAERGTALVAGASLLLAATAVQFMTVPTVPADWVTPREGARLVALAVLLGGVYMRYANVQRRRAHCAIRSERERAARDLHDGLAQDLACIATAAQRLDCNLGPEHPLVLATRDALAQLRGIIADLTASTAATSEDAVGLVARELARRLDLEVTVRSEDNGASAVDDGLELRSRDDLIRATREAIERTAVGCEARHVDLALSRDAGKVVLHASAGPLSMSAPSPVGVAVAKRRARVLPGWAPEWSRRARQRRPV